MDIRGRIPRSCSSSFHVSDVNRESLSDTMSVGSPWKRHTSLANVLAKWAAVFSFSGRKCAIFVKRSMITQSWSHSSDIGRSVIKSMAIDCQGAYGSSSGEDSPYGWCLEALFF